MPSQKINKFIFRFIEFLLLITVAIFLVREIFFPFPSRLSYPDYILINKGQIIFEGVVNYRSRKVLNLISFDTRGWCSRLGIWPPEVFQKELDSHSLILTGVKLEAIQQVILQKRINWWHVPFRGRIVVKCRQKSFQLMPSWRKVSLERIVFLGLGIGEYLKFYRQPSQKLSPPRLFLRNILSLPLNFNKDKFLSVSDKCSKVKVIVEFDEKN